MIYGKHIRLRAVERTDLPKFVIWMNDPEVIDGLLMRIPLSFADEERWFDAMAQRPAAERVLAIESRLGDSWQLIGSTGFHDIDPIDREAEFGISIGEKKRLEPGIWHRGQPLDAKSWVRNIELKPYFFTSPCEQPARGPRL